MSRNKNLNLTLQVSKYLLPQIILRVFVSTAICKPLNGSAKGSKISALLKLYSVTYKYDSKGTTKTSRADTYLIKGLRGAVRHGIMMICKTIGLEICHTSDKEKDKHDVLLLPSGFHLQASCLEQENECIVHKFLGSKNHKSKISVSAPPIVFQKYESANYEDSEFPVQPVHMATENRVAMTYDGKPIQDFGERYFSGVFYFEINVTECKSEELGLIIEAVRHLEKLGRGFNSGYGHIEVKQIQMFKRTFTEALNWSEDSQAWKIVRKLEDKALKNQLLDALTTWQKYVENLKSEF